jgi:hypothetical protein
MVEDKAVFMIINSASDRLGDESGHDKLRLENNAVLKPALPRTWLIAAVLAWTKLLRTR